MDKLDPRVRIAVVVMMSILCFVLRQPLAIVAALVVALALWRSVGLGVDELRAGIRPLRLVFVLVVLMQGIFYPGATPVTIAWPSVASSGAAAAARAAVTLPVTVEGLLFGVLLCLRLLVLAFTVPILTARTSVDRIVLALTRLGLPYRTAFTVSSALNQIPVLRSDVATITAAQRLRGSVAFERGHPLAKLVAYPALVVPLVMTSMRRANLMGVAMHSRAFGSGRTRTSIHALTFRRLDAVVLAASAVVAFLLVWLDRVL